MRRAMRPGRLRHRLTLQKKAVDPDGTGGGTAVWTAVATVWAALEPVSAAARRRGEGTAQIATIKITIRYRTGVATGDRFVAGSRVFTVMAAFDPDEAGAWLACLCTEET